MISRFTVYCSICDLCMVNVEGLEFTPPLERWRNGRLWKGRRRTPPARALAAPAPCIPALPSHTQSNILPFLQGSRRREDERGDLKQERRTGDCCAVDSDEGVQAFNVPAQRCRASRFHAAFGFRVSGLGFRVQGSRVKIWGFGLRASGFGFRI